MADIDIDPFGEHESRTDDHTDTGENIPLIPGGPEGTPTVEDQLGNQKEENRKYHLEEESLKEPN